MRNCFTFPLLSELLTRGHSYYWILRAFQSSSGSISDLVSGLNTMRGAARDLNLYGSFLENHDVARFPSFTQDTVSLPPPKPPSRLHPVLTWLFSGRHWQRM